MQISSILNVLKFTGKKELFGEGQRPVQIRIMNIVVFTHPDFINSQSMPKYARMLANGMKKRGHKVEIWKPRRFFYKLPIPQIFKKWSGYLDQFLLFPIYIKWKLVNCPRNTLFVFADHALGPWMSLVLKRPFVVHCHDFLAQRSALGEIAENKVQLPGKIYQQIIRKGYQKGDYFISVSEKTKNDLHRFLNRTPKCSWVVYNGLNQEFKPGDQTVARFKLSKELKLDLNNGFILHVGGNEFYKNKKGVIKIYNEWRSAEGLEIPLLLVGFPPNRELQKLMEDLPFSSEIIFATKISDYQLRLCYQAATTLLFPSIAEGFGWPIAEAMASGCPVITTNSPPMSEVGGRAAMYVPPYVQKNGDKEWVKTCVNVLDKAVNLNEEEKNNLILLGIETATRFNTQNSLDQIEKHYLEVLDNFTVNSKVKKKNTQLAIDK